MGRWTTEGFLQAMGDDCANPCDTGALSFSQLEVPSSGQLCHPVCLGLMPLPIHHFQNFGAHFFKIGQHVFFGQHFADTQVKVVQELIDD